MLSSFKPEGGDVELKCKSSLSARRPDDYQDAKKRKRMCCLYILCKTFAMCTYFRDFQDLKISFILSGIRFCILVILVNPEIDD